MIFIFNFCTLIASWWNTAVPLVFFIITPTPVISSTVTAVFFIKTNISTFVIARIFTLVWKPGIGLWCDLCYVEEYEETEHHCADHCLHCLSLSTVPGLTSQLFPSLHSHLLTAHQAGWYQAPGRIQSSRPAPGPRRAGCGGADWLLYILLVDGGGGQMVSGLLLQRWGGGILNSLYTLLRGDYYVLENIKIFSKL